MGLAGARLLVGGVGLAGARLLVGGVGLAEARLLVGGVGLAGARLLVGDTVPVISTPAHLGFALHIQGENTGCSLHVHVYIPLLHMARTHTMHTHAHTHTHTHTHTHLAHSRTDVLRINGMCSISYSITAIFPIAPITGNTHCH